MIISQIYRLKSNYQNNTNDINQLHKIITDIKYKITSYTNYDLDIEYIIKQLSIKHLCRLFIDGSVNFIINDDSKIEYYPCDIMTIYLLNMKKNNITYIHIIMND